jgi:AraC-like DNA-binding protein
MTFDIALGLVTAGIAIFSVSLLLPLTRKKHYVMPLALFIFIQAVIALEPLVFHSFHNLEVYYIALSGIVWMLMMPSLWLYIKGLTATYAWQWQKKELHHCWLSLFALLVGAAILVLPNSSGGELTTGFEVTVAVLILILLLIWPIQSALYVYKIAGQLTRYRKDLKQVFTDERNRALYWVNAALAFLVMSWLWLLGGLFTSLLETEYDSSGSIAMLVNLIAVWLFSFWALTQKPAFIGLYKQLAQAPIAMQSSRVKYEKSAIGAAQAQRIAKKLDVALQDEQLYLNSELTLYGLAEHLHIPAHYISQTLNQTMNTSFFDWINCARVEQAKKQLVSSDSSVLDVAMAVGFNSRSAFYKAFKARTGTTPSVFRKQATHEIVDEP